MQNPAIIYHAHQVLIATANLPTHKATTHKQQRQQQRDTVRQLLAYCLSYYPDYLEFQGNTHPYYLFDPSQNKKFFVSFSHSHHQVALIITPSPCGIDIEHSPISPQIAHRFFHPNELNLLNSLSADTQAFARLKLWQLKESFAKASVSTLSSTLSQDFSDILQNILYHQPINPNNIYSIHQIYQDKQWLALTLSS